MMIRQAGGLEGAFEGIDREAANRRHARSAAFTRERNNRISLCNLGVWMCMVLIWYARRYDTDSTACSRSTSRQNHRWPYIFPAFAGIAFLHRAFGHPELVSRFVSISILRRSELMPCSSSARPGSPLSTNAEPSTRRGRSTTSPSHHHDFDESFGRPLDLFGSHRFDIRLRPRVYCGFDACHHDFPSTTAHGDPRRLHTHSRWPEVRTR